MAAFPLYSNGFSGVGAIPNDLLTILSISGVNGVDDTTFSGDDARAVTIQVERNTVDAGGGRRAASNEPKEDLLVAVYSGGELLYWQVVNNMAGNNQDIAFSLDIALADVLSAYEGDTISFAFWTGTFKGGSTSSGAFDPVRPPVLPSASAFDVNPRPSKNQAAVVGNADIVSASFNVALNGEDDVNVAPTLEAGPAFGESFVEWTVSDANLDGTLFSSLVWSIPAATDPTSFASGPANDGSKTTISFTEQVSVKLQGILRVQDGGTPPLGVDVAFIEVGTAAGEVLNAGSSLRPAGLWGFGGTDTLTGGAQADALFGGDGDDVLNGGAGNDTMLGGAGNDSFADQAGDNIIDGGAGNDTIFTGQGKDTIQGGADDDLIVVGAAGTSPTIDGGTGNDTISGNSGGELLVGGDGDDIITGSGGNDTIDGGLGADRLDGGSGADVLSYATDTADLTVNLGSPTGHTGGQAQGDVITGFEILIGGSGNDRLTGDDAGNSLLGGSGNDALSGRGGADVLAGGDGADSLTGGAGDDVFEVTATSSQALTSASLASDGSVAATVIDGNTNLAFANGVDIITDFKTAGDGGNNLDVPVGGSLTTLEGVSLGGILAAGVYVAYGDFSAGVFNVNQDSAFASGANDALVLISDGITPISPNVSPTSSGGWIVMENLASVLSVADFI